MATKANLVAVGSYLRRLREQHGMSVTKVAGVLDTSEAQIRKIERGSVDTRGSMLVNYCELVKGDLGDVAQLMLSEQATAEHGARLAERWLQGPGGKRELLQVAEAPGEYVVNGKA